MNTSDAAKAILLDHMLDLAGTPEIDLCSPSAAIDAARATQRAALGKALEDAERWRNLLKYVMKNRMVRRSNGMFVPVDWHHRQGPPPWIPAPFDVMLVEVRKEIDREATL